LDNFYQIKTKVATVQRDTYCSKLGVPTLELNTAFVSSFFGNLSELSSEGRIGQLAPVKFHHILILIHEIAVLFLASPDQAPIRQQ
jgi:hypothetical protein